MLTGREIFSRRFCEIRHHLHRHQGELESLNPLLDREYASEEDFLEVFEAWRLVVECKQEMNSYPAPKSV